MVLLCILVICPRIRCYVFDAEYADKHTSALRKGFLTGTDRTVSWNAQRALMEPAYLKVGEVRWRHSLKTILPIQLMQNWIGYGDAGMDDAQYKTAPMKFAGLPLRQVSDHWH